MHIRSHTGETPEDSDNVNLAENDEFGEIKVELFTEENRAPALAGTKCLEEQGHSEKIENVLETNRKFTENTKGSVCARPFK